MLELGPESAVRHAELARAVEEARLDLVFCAGPLMKSLYEALPASHRGGWAPDAEALLQTLAGALGPGDVLMVKGSRDSRAAALVAGLVALQHEAPEVEGA
jgi:UDP-N-acetylmuramoyl-tripeptide--D-alanyl-D-alanine ligase